MVSVRGNQPNNKVTASASTSTNNRAEVKPVNINNQVEATNNLAKYYSEISQDWAVGEGLIQNIDYSSKTYALQAKESATEAKTSLDEAKGYASDAVEEIQNLEQAVLSNISMLEQSASSTVEQGIQTIGETVTEGVDTIETTSDTAIEEIKSVSDKIINKAGFDLFDTKLSDHILTYEETKGWALQGTFVYKDAIAGERYGYPDFINKCIEEKEAGVATQVTLGSSTITMYVNSNGHQFYDIADKVVVDTWYNTYGIADFYGVDTENECVFLPRNNYFMQLTCDITKVNKFNEAGLPTLTTNSTGAHTHTRGTMDIKGSFKIDSAVGLMAAAAAATGAFVRNETQLTRSPSTDTGSGAKYGVDFQASRNWTGATSSDGAHTHTIAGTADTVQPPSSNKLLYYCVGTTVSDIHWIDAVTQVEAGVKDLEDKTLEGIERLKQSSTALTQTQITNCLLEVPQRIKLELNNGVLTLKAGSEVIVPNGFESDGTTPKFDYVIIESDSTIKNGANQQEVILSENGNITGGVPSAWAYSGATQPTVTTTFALWYDTTTNKMKLTLNNGSTWIEGLSLPIALATSSTAQYTSIDQVFNGFGYIGSTVWVDKGVKGLIPNGRNEDGSLKNVEFITKTLKTFGYTGSVGNWFFGLNENGDELSCVKKFYYEQNSQPSVTSETQIWYNPTENKFYYSNWQNTTNFEPRDICIVASKTYDSNTNITSFNPKQPFRAVDYNDYTDLKNTKVSKSGDTMTGNLMINCKTDTSNIIVKGNKAVGTIPSSTYNYGYFGAYDSNNTHLGGVAVMQNTSGIVTAYLRATADSNSNIKQITVSSNGATSCPASSATNSIVTTTGISKASNGYVKLGNGIIINWGRVSINANTSVTVTFPVAFTSTNYKVAVTIYSTSATSQKNVSANNYTTTNFKIYNGQGGTCPYDWIAIGY